MLFHELTAINVVLAYSTAILEMLFGTSSQGFNARDGTYLIGLINFLSSSLSIVTMTYAGRRPLLLAGHTGICLTYVLMAVFTLKEINYGVLFMMCLFLLIYQNTSGPVAWAYAAETCCDVSLGISILVLYSTVLCLTLVTQPLMNSALQQYGVFFLFSFFNFCAIFFVYFNIPETKGLPDDEKKRLFYPGSKWGRKLQPGEQQLPLTPDVNARRPSPEALGDTATSSFKEV